MNKAQLKEQIHKSWIYIKAAKIDEVFSGPASLDPSVDFKTVSVDPDASYEEVYLTGMRGGEYNILLRDYSFFQFGVTNQGDARFAYYPNPFIGADPNALNELADMREYISEGVVTMDQFLHRVSELRRSQHPPLVRYEYSKQQYVEASHPCSHLHIGFHDSNRWPVRRYLTAHAFTLMILRLFYLELWLKAEPLTSGPERLQLDEILAKVRADCRMLYENEFSASEERRFYLV